MSDVTDAALTQRINELTTRNANLTAALKQERGVVKDLNTALAEAKDQLDKVAAASEGWKAKAEALPSEVAKENERLRGEIRTRDHKDVFRSKAKAAGAHEDMLDDLWTLSGYKAEADEPDEAGIVETIESLKTAKARFFNALPDAGGLHQTALNGASQPVLTRGLGSGRGAPGTPLAPALPTEEQMRNPVFMAHYQQSLLPAK